MVNFNKASLWGFYFFLMHLCKNLAYYYNIRLLFIQRILCYIMSYRYLIYLTRGCIYDSNWFFLSCYNNILYRYVEHVIKMSAKKALKRTIPTGNPWQTADRLGNKNCHQALKKGNSPSKKPLKRKAGKGKSPRCQMCIRPMTVLSRLQPPLQVTHRTVQPHKKMLICRLDGCYLHSLTRLTDDNDVEHKIEKIWDLNGMNVSHWTVY